jgi:DNA-binding transcriptional LysR family regulator
MFKNAKLTMDVKMEFDNVELLKRAVEINAGLSILPEGNVEREARHGELATVGFRNPDAWQRPLGILRRRGKAHSPAERQFLSLLQQGGQDS